MKWPITSWLLRCGTSDFLSDLTKASSGGLCHDRSDQPRICHVHIGHSSMPLGSSISCLSAGPISGSTAASAGSVVSGWPLETNNGNGCQGTAPPFMNGYADSGLPRMRTAFARIVPCIFRRRRPTWGQRASNSSGKNMTRKYLAVFHLLYMARDKERKRGERGEDKKGRVTRTASNISCSLSVCHCLGCFSFIGARPNTKASCMSSLGHVQLDTAQIEYGAHTWMTKVWVCNWGTSYPTSGFLAHFRCFPTNAKRTEGMFFFSLTWPVKLFPQPFPTISAPRSQPSVAQAAPCRWEILAQHMQHSRPILRAARTAQVVPETEATGETGPEMDGNCLYTRHDNLYDRNDDDPINHWIWGTFMFGNSANKELRCR